MNVVESTPEFVEAGYERMERTLDVIRGKLKRPLTFAEKIILGHIDDPITSELNPGSSYIYLCPDRVAMQDATAQMAILQFMQAGKDSVAVPTTVHCDHLIRAYSGAKKDLQVAIEENKEVYDFLASASAKYGIGFWKPGAGIIHQVVLENYAFPGGMMIGTDSHTPNAGGLGMFASGVGGADAVDVMAGFPWEVLYPRLIGVRLTGKLSGWTAPKDIILKLCGILTVKGGTNRIIEYFGPGVKSLSCTGKATITNMGAELGATTSIFPFDDRMDKYLRATKRASLADLAIRYKKLLSSDSEVEENPENFYEKIIEIDLSKLEPYIVGPHTPDLARPVSDMAKSVHKEKYPDRITYALIGSCTNSSYEDMGRAAKIAMDAIASGLKVKTPLLVTPGSEQIRATIERDGQMKALEDIGATVLANACGPCIGQWKREDVKQGDQNSIVSSFNRNFPKRNDGNPSTLSFLASPEIVVALALSGSLSFNPEKNTLKTDDNKDIMLSPPGEVPDLPECGFVADKNGYLEPSDNPSKINIKVNPDSERLQVLTPFTAWDGKDLLNMPILIKAKGKCTTDHISPAGPWLKYRGHLDKISDNLLSGATNAFTGESGKGINLLTGEKGLPISKIARDYKTNGIRWVAVGDENYGEGSSREHAAMSPRYLGASAIIARSFARIHESNLKKQGILPLTFVISSDYDKIREDDKISITGLNNLSPSNKIRAILHHSDGKNEEIFLNHTLNEDQIEWFKAGSALNVLKGQS